MNFINKKSGFTELSYDELSKIQGGRSLWYHASRAAKSVWCYLQDQASHWGDDPVYGGGDTSGTGHYMSLPG